MAHRLLRFGTLLGATLYLAAACSSSSDSSNDTSATGGSSGTTTSTSTGGSIPEPSGEAAAKVVAAAEAWLATLDADLLARAQLDFDSDQKSVWSNYPISDVERNGVQLAEMTEAQAAAALAVLQALLSEEGYTKVTGIRNSDEIMSQRNPPYTSGNEYYLLAIFGTPSLTEPWMVQFNGHHMALNATIVGNNIVMTPSLTGNDPGTYTWEGQTVVPLADETEKGFAMVNALDEDQKAQAIIGSEVIDLVLGPGKDGLTVENEGSPVSGWTTAQKELLVDLASEWVDFLNDESAAVKLAEIEANLDETYFAWSGPTTSGSPVYYRITGPTVLIEFSNQFRKTTHIHAMYREPGNDYGAKLISR